MLRWKSIPGFQFHGQVRRRAPECDASTQAEEGSNSRFGLFDLWLLDLLDAFPMKMSFTTGLHPSPVLPKWFEGSTEMWLASIQMLQLGLGGCPVF